MFQMKYSDVAKFMSQAGGQAVHKLETLQVPLPVSYTITKIKRELMKAMEQVHKEHGTDIVDKFRGLEEDGTPKAVVPTQEWWDKTKEAELEAAKLVFDARIMDIDWRKLKWAEIEGCRFSAAELDILEPIIELPPEPKADTPLKLV